MGKFTIHKITLEELKYTLHKNDEDNNEKDSNMRQQLLNVSIEILEPSDTDSSDSINKRVIYNPEINLEVIENMFNLSLKISGTIIPQGFHITDGESFLKENENEHRILKPLLEKAKIIVANITNESLPIPRIISLNYSEEDIEEIK